VNIGHTIENSVLRSAIYTTVRHWLETHPWAYPVVAVVVVLLWLHGRRRSRARRPAGPLAGQSARAPMPENVTVLARPTEAKGKGHWEWQEDSQHTSGG
jgi:hypothetical protein